MTERGILFTPENYGKVEDGSKVQTRRIMELQPTDKPDISRCSLTKNGSKPVTAAMWIVEGDLKACVCPYGTVGDRLYVKEGLEKEPGTPGVRYRRDQQSAKTYVTGESMLWEWQKDYLSPLHMPKWAARLWLELTDVRVERLHDISEADAFAEGIAKEDPRQSAVTTLLRFRRLWESNKIHKPGSWEMNPWVWCLTFTKVRPA